MKRGKLILLLVLLLLIGGYFLLRSRAGVEKQKPIFAPDSTHIARIEIFRDRQSIVFAKANEHWSIVKPIQWEVENERFLLFFQQVINQNYGTTPLAQGKEALAQYQLEDSLALRISVWDDKDKLRTQAYFSNLNNPFDYFRFQGDDKVYQIRQKVASIYTPDPAGWRSPHVLSIPPEQLARISVVHPKNSYELTRDGNLWHYKDRRESFDIPAGNTTMGKIQNLISRLDAYKMLDKDEVAQDSLVNPICTVELSLSDGGARKLSFFKQDKTYLMSVDSHPGIYFEVLFDTVFRFTRHAALFRARVGELPPEP